MLCFFIGIFYIIHCITLPYFDAEKSNVHITHAAKYLYIIYYWRTAITIRRPFFGL